MRRRDFVPTDVRTAMGEKPYRHDLVRAATKKLWGIEVARPGKTAFEKARKGR